MIERKTGNLLVKAISMRTAHKHMHLDMDSILDIEKGISSPIALTIFLSVTSMEVTIARMYKREEPRITWSRTVLSMVRGLDLSISLVN